MYFLWYFEITSFKGSLPKKKIADFETLSQLALPSPPISPIETFLIETFLVLFDPVTAIETLFFFQI